MTGGTRRGGGRMVKGAECQTAVHAPVPGMHVMSSLQMDKAPADPRVTFLVVAFNHAQYVEQCLESCFAQSMPVDVIVVDDASADDTSAVVTAWAESSGNPLRLITHVINHGLGASLQEALALVETPFLAYIAADDWSEPGRLRTQLAALERAGRHCALAYSDAYRTRADGSRISTLAATMGPDFQSGASDIYHALLRSNWIPAPTILVRTEALRAVGGYDPDIFYEDHDVVLRLARDYDFTYTPAPLASHRELPTALGARLFQREFRDQLLEARWRIYRKHLGGGQETDEYVAPLLTETLRELYLLGRDPREISRRYKEVRLFQTRKSRNRVLSLASARLPGKVAQRLLDLRPHKAISR